MTRILFNVSRIVGLKETIAAIPPLAKNQNILFFHSIIFRTMSTVPNNTLDLNKIGKNMVKKVPSMEEVPLESIWQDNTVVLTFFRRFGCIFCRQEAKDLSTITSLLSTHGVKNVAVGLESFGLEDFVKGQFFNGDLYVDVDKKTYKDIGYKRFGLMGVMRSLFQKPARERLAQNRKEKLPSNLRGDGMQSGGCLVIAKGGSEILLDYRQNNPADHVELSEILRVLGIPNLESFPTADSPSPKVCS